MTITAAGRYRKGRTFEYDVRDHLAEHGWVSTRAAGSKGGMKTDLVSFHPLGVILLVQCKTNGVISESEWNRLYEVSLWNPMTRAVIAYKIDGNISLDKLTGYRVRMKPMLNRIRYDASKATQELALRGVADQTLDKLAR
jgi:hypothetical protein